MRRILIAVLGYIAYSWWNKQKTTPSTAENRPRNAGGGGNHPRPNNDRA